MSILLNKETKILVQGITGSEGLFHSIQMLDYGSHIICGVTTGKGGETVTDNNIPVFNSIAEAREKLGVGVSEPQERQDTKIQTEWE